MRLWRVRTARVHSTYMTLSCRSSRSAQAGFQPHCISETGENRPVVFRWELTASRSHLQGLKAFDSVRFPPPVRRRFVSHLCPKSRPRHGQHISTELIKAGGPCPVLCRCCCCCLHLIIYLSSNQSLRRPRLFLCNSRRSPQLVTLPRLITSPRFNRKEQNFNSSCKTSHKVHKQV